MLRRRPRYTRGPIFLSHSLLMIGILLIAWAAHSHVYAFIQQSILLSRAEQLSPAVSPPIPDDWSFIWNQYEEQRNHEQPHPEPEPDLGPFIIEIPKLGMKAAVVDGVTEADLAMGPGFYPGSPAPGQPGNVCIAGHRTTYGAWFRRVNELVPGDIILLTSPIAVYRYEVEEVFVVASDAWEVVAATPGYRLTLTTCHPLGSDRQRLVVRAILYGSDS